MRQWICVEISVSYDQASIATVWKRIDLVAVEIHVLRYNAVTTRYDLT